MVALIEVLGIIAVQIAVLYFIVKVAVKKALKEYDEDRNREADRD